jgi:D-alanyl-D-alanine carboxypeptidase
MSENLRRKSCAVSIGFLLIASGNLSLLLCATRSDPVGLGRGLSQAKQATSLNSIGPGFDGENVRKHLTLILERFQSQSHFPGATLAVYFPDQPSISIAVGLSDRDKGIKMAPNDRMLTGSAGKTFFAALALQLVAQNKLRLDEPIGTYLAREPWFSRLPNANQVTVRMLMSHMSGFGEYGEKFMASLVNDPMRQRSHMELIECLFDSVPTSRPGQQFRYSDLNFDLLAMILEHVTKTPAYVEIERRFLRPLRLQDTLPSDRPRIPGLIPGYAGKSNPFGGDIMMKDGQMILNPQFEWGGGGFASTAENLARWISAFCEGRAFSTSLWPEVVKGVNAPEVGKGSRYGLGIHIDETPIGRAYGHGGFFPGYFTWIRWYERQKVAVAIQLNTSDNSLVNRDLKEILDEAATAVVQQTNR